MAQIVIASRLADGRVVFLAEGSGAESVRWAAMLGEAAVAEDDARADTLLELGEADAGRRHEVVDPYLIEVEKEAGEWRPTKYREVIRCLGPTIRTDLGKQAEVSARAVAA